MPVPPHAQLRAAVILAALAATAHALADCRPATGQSTCFDADSRWAVALPSPFATFGAPLRQHAVGSVGLDADYLKRPVVLEAPAPDPRGRAFTVIDDRVDAALTGSFSPLPWLAVTGALPLVAAQTGSGLTGITRTSERDVTSPALRDPKVGVAATALERRFARSAWVGLRGELELSLPLGTQSAFARARTVVAAPRVSSSVFVKWFYAGASVGARLKGPVEIAGTHLGHQLTWAAGVGAEILDERRLTFSLEARALLTLRSQDSTLPDGSHASGRHLPAEWLASLGTQWPAPHGRWSAFAGGGMGIPLSTRRVEDGTGTQRDHFVGLAAPAVRALVGARYVFGG